MSVLIVIPCLNEEAHLPHLLGALLAENAQATIVVADGGSTDRSRIIVKRAMERHANLHLLDNPARIQSAGVNLAAQQFGADHRWMVRIDAHCAYPAGYVAGLVEAAEKQRATSVVVPMVTKGTACFQSAVAAVQNSVLGNGGSLHRNVAAGRWVDHGHHALFKLALFLRVGGYDEGFSHNEDAELDHRLSLSGGRIWLEPAQAITYFPRRTAGPLWRQYLGYGRGRAQNFRRHRMPMKWRQALPLMIAPMVALALLGLFVAGFDLRGLLLAGPALVWALMCFAYGLVLAFRHRSACVLCSGFAAMVIHLGWSAGFLREHLRLRANWR